MIAFSVGCLGLALNFVEVMALQRMFSVGRFKCSGPSAMVAKAEFPREGYVLLIKKKMSGRFCLGCVRDFVAKKPALRLAENEDYLTVYSP